MTRLCPERATEGRKIRSSIIEIRNKFELKNGRNHRNEIQQVELFRILLPRTFDIVSIFGFRISSFRPIRPILAQHLGYGGAALGHPRLNLSPKTFCCLLSELLAAGLRQKATPKVLAGVLVSFP